MTTESAVEMTGGGATEENSRLALRVVLARHRVSLGRPYSLGNRRRRDFHIPTAPPRRLSLSSNPKHLAPFGREPNQRKESFQPQDDADFQAHPALE